MQRATVTSQAPLPIEQFIGHHAAKVKKHFSEDSAKAKDFNKNMFL